MPNFIPRLEWNDISIIGDSVITSPTIINVVSTTSVIVGMIINHANFLGGTYVLSKTSNTVTLSTNATANGATLTFPLFQRFDFNYPSIKQAEPTYLPTEVISESISGVRQVQINNVIKEISLEFKFVTNTLKAELETKFYTTWAMYGKDFRYFESNDVGTSETYSLKNLDFKPTREIPKAGNFLYKIPFTFRRVYL